ncbi:MAG: ATP-binding protein [Methanothrix sp.]|uniref:DUF499 domain-containing protein n=1 Tax=Methanothrix sp. TaxID=90426 RepID=UPI001B453A1B|nr:DUF499 domain-containing protein [Methanothrix sp.]MBP7066715.1 ATP-binding protein [Methanothrix sp.]
MTRDMFLPIWNSTACVPRPEVISGMLTDSDLALSLPAVIGGSAKPPYNDPRTFFAATYMTQNMKHILEFLFGRLSGARPDANPIIVLDVGFGGGKTHTLVALFYAAKYGTDSAISPNLSGIPIPQDMRVVTVSGDEYGGQGIMRHDTPISTLWGDIFWQLGVYERFRQLDLERIVPSLDEVRSAIGEAPTLVLLDELPTYLNLVGSSDKLLIEKTVQFVQRLVNVIAEKDRAALVIAIAGDAYFRDAENLRERIAKAMGSSDEAEMVIAEAKQGMDDARAFIRRKEYVISPIEETDAVHILKKRLFSSISLDAAKVTAASYHELYQGIAEPDYLKNADYANKIEESYPFHPYLTKLLYERVATIDRFNNTRGALRLLTRTVRRIWSEKEEDAYLIHPFHIELADSGIRDDLTYGVGEEKLRNAIEADVAQEGGGSVAQILDREVSDKWKAPLHRRTCNTIYLSSLATGREEDKGINADLLAAVLAVPGHPDYLLRVRDQVFPTFKNEFHYIDRKGTRYVFVRELSPLRVIDQEARNVTDQEATKEIRTGLEDLFSIGPDWIHVEIFPQDPSRLQDDKVIKLAILNPNLHHLLHENDLPPESVIKFLTYRDAQSMKFRQFKNDTFLLVAEDSGYAAMMNTAKKLISAKRIRKNPKSFGIPQDRKQDVEERFSELEKSIYDDIRGAFCKFIYYNNQGRISVASLNMNGYGGGKNGKDMFAYHLENIFHRIKNDIFDPGYVDNDVMSPGTPYLSMLSLFETFHAKPGVIIPATQALFIDTIKRGVEEKKWILKRGNNVYTDRDIGELGASNLAVDKGTEVWRWNEAKERGLLDKPTEVQTPIRIDDNKGKNVPIIQKVLQEGPVPFTYAFQESPADNLARDLETYLRSKSAKVDQVIIRTSGDSSSLNAINNVITALSAEQACDISLEVEARRYTDPKVNIEFSSNKADLGSPFIKILIDATQRMTNSESFEAAVTLRWQEFPLETLTEKVRSLGRLAQESLFSMEISGVGSHR